jgi:signal transduction histidine kinase/putative methionine-R-sulfoxide reductase with GAF domain
VPPSPDADRAGIEAQLADSLEREAAMRDVLRAISGSPSDVQPVFDRIASAALALCRASSALVGTYDGSLVHIGALASTTAAGADAVRSIFPRPASRDNGTTRAILTRATVTIPDILEDDDFRTASESVAAGFRSVLAVPLLDDGRPIGAISVGRALAGAFPPAQVRLLETFAEQAVVAVVNTRRFRELQDRNHDLVEALEQQTATSEVLLAISASPNDVRPVFETIAQAALKLCHATAANVVTFDGALVHLAALANADAAAAEGLQAHFRTYPRPPSRETANTRAVLTRSVVMIPDVLADPEYAAGATAIRAGYRSIVAVPLMRGETAMGAITVARSGPGPFPDKQVRLLKTFASQAVIAIENARLVAELEARNGQLTEALEHQTATSDILGVISSSPTDVGPVFEIIAERASRLCDAQVSVVSRLEGETIHLGAIHGATQAGIGTIRRYFPMPLRTESVTARAIRGRKIVELADALADPTYGMKDAARAAPWRSCVAVPMVRGDDVIGAIFVSRAERGRFPESKRALLKTFADQAVIAIENVRLFNELAARSAALARSVGELRALGEVGEAVSATLDLDTVLGTIVDRATQLTGMDGGSIYEYDAARDEFVLRAADRLPAELVDALRATPMRKGEGALGRMALTGEPVVVRDLSDETVYQSRVREVLLRLGYRSVLAVPLLRENSLLGGIVMNRKRAGPFEPETISLMQTFASQSALALQNARLYREVEQKGRELEAASRHKSEFLANMSHELRTPLNAIIGFSEVLAERMFGELNAKQAEYVDDILASGLHLLALINDILDLSKIEAGRMELDATDVDVAATVTAAVTLVRERAHRRGVGLACEIAPGLGTLRADERKVKQVLLNLLSNALMFTPEGGSVGVRARVVDGRCEIAVTDTGVGIAPDDHAAVFEEFRQVGSSTKKVEGTGLGLAISRKYAELHGGTLTVASELGRGATFTLTLPR